MEWQTWVFTEVLFKSDDRLSFAMALISLVPLLSLLVLFIFVAVPTHLSRNAARMLLILLANEAICQGLKRVFRQPRPLPPWDPEFALMSGRQLGFGMPSSHTQLVFCAATVTTALAKAVPRFRVFRYGAWAVAVLVGVSRVYNGYHSVAQVAVGAALGVLVALVLVRVSLLKTISERLVAAIQTVTIM
jgi:dolichyldiphosphatase